MDQRDKQAQRERHERFLKKHYRTRDEERRIKDEARRRKAERRNEAARYFDHALKSITGLRPARVADYVTNHAWHLYPMRYDPDGFGGKSRDEFLAALRAEGVPCSSGYGRPLSEHGGIVAVKNRHPALIAAEPSPNTEHIGATAVWFSQTLLTADHRDLADVPEAIHRIQKAFNA